MLLSNVGGGWERQHGLLAGRYFMRCVCVPVGCMFSMVALIGLGSSRCKYLLQLRMDSTIRYVRNTAEIVSVGHKSFGRVGAHKLVGMVNFLFTGLFVAQNELLNYMSVPE